MSSLLLLFLILSLTTHVCEGRYLSFSSINELNIPAHHQIKVVAMKMKHNKVLEASEMKDDKGTQEMVSGSTSETLIPSSHAALLLEVQFKAGSSNKDGLFVREESKHKEEKEEFNHTGVETDIGFMDYQQPHRGPSTHNK
ncbi:hypothetical protein KFK09_028116 [Dendrobium nobile]|uniref:Uncharacterized protein n=1 Tax=Dendrobium nobile TaxID=94219 RepID=A0A8T3A1N5_DENNO|nr:hypothetical protein KFK09_028116 [Dendrobium nobile]